MKSKPIKRDFEMRSGNMITVTVIVKRIKLNSDEFNMQFSCYDIVVIPKLLDKLISEVVLKQIDNFIKDKCIYLHTDIKEEESGQLSLF